MLDRSSVRKQEPILWGQLWWGVLVSFGACLHRAGVSTPGPATRAAANTAAIAQGEAVLRCWGALSYPLSHHGSVLMQARLKGKARATVGTEQQVHHELIPSSLIISVPCVLYTWCQQEVLRSKDSVDI